MFTLCRNRIFLMELPLKIFCSSASLTTSQIENKSDSSSSSSSLFSHSQTISFFFFPSPEFCSERSHGERFFDPLLFESELSCVSS